MPNFLIFARILDYIYQIVFFFCNILSRQYALFYFKEKIMKKLFIIAMGILLSASMANAFDIKGNAVDAASDVANGKSAKEVAEAKKKEAVNAVKTEAEKNKKS